MSIYEIAVFTDDDYDEIQELDGREYFFRINWNPRDNGFYLSAYQPDGTRLACGRRLNVGTPLFRGEVDTRLPPGVLIPVDLSQKDLDPTQAELGQRVLLLYYDEEELAT